MAIAAATHGAPGSSGAYETRGTCGSRPIAVRTRLRLRCCKSRIKGRKRAVGFARVQQPVSGRQHAQFAGANYLEPRWPILPPQIRPAGNANARIRG